MLQNAGLKEGINIAIKKNLRESFRKVISPSYHMALKIFIEGSCTDIIHAGEKEICSCYF